MYEKVKRQTTLCAFSVEKVRGHVPPHAPVVPLTVLACGLWVSVVGPPSTEHYRRNVELTGEQYTV